MSREEEAHVTHTHTHTYPLVEGVPSQVGGVQVVLQSLRVGVLAGALDEALAHGVGVLQPRLDAVHLLPLHGLEGKKGHAVSQQQQQKNKVFI